MHILFIGYGQTAQRVAKRLADHQITSVSLSAQKQSLTCHLQQDVQQLNLESLDAIDCVYILLSPKDRTKYKQTYLDSVTPILTALKKHSIQRLIVVSSTRVYNGCKDVVTDESVLCPNDEQGRVLQQMEQLYQDAFPEQSVVVRPTGIYGTSVKRMVTLAKNTQLYTCCHWTNRIHIDDLSRFLAMLATLKNPEASYIVSDSRPYPLHQVILWFQRQLNLPELHYLPEGMSGKKVNATSLQQIGFVPQYQNCFDVYAQLLKKEH